MSNPKPKVKRYFDGDDERPAKITKRERIKNKREAQTSRRNIEKVIKFNKNLHKTKFEDVDIVKQPVEDEEPKLEDLLEETNPELLKKYSRGRGIVIRRIKSKLERARVEKKEAKIQFATELTAKAETLLAESSGFLEAEDGETTRQFTQQEIARCVDVTAASKHFELHLTEFGPYRAKYTRNGRHLLLGGRKGHIGAFDWVTKKLHCEFNVMEEITDISWLHVETMMAVAQKKWVYVYDNQGIELHCVKAMNKVTRMEFLPYHFLLATAADTGDLTWLDISIGEIIGRTRTNMGRLSLLTQNPYNATLCVGHSKGVVTMWSPTSKDYLAKMLCHKAPLSAIHVDPTGVYMATGAINKEFKIWDVRLLKGPVQDYKLHASPSHIQFSQKYMLAVGMGNVVDVFRDCCTQTSKKPYLRARFNTPIGNFAFCPFEDVLGVATAKSFTSVLVPGSGEANFDALELNPYQTKTQRREHEVKALLEKIPAELITLDPTTIDEVDVPSMRDQINMKKELLYLNPPKINFKPRQKAKAKGGSVQMARNKKIVQELNKKEFIKNMKGLLPEQGGHKIAKEKVVHGVLNRFLPKTE